MGYRVMILHPQMYINGGAELSIVKFIQHLKSRNIYDIVLITSAVSKEIADEIKGIDIISARMPSDINANFPVFLNYVESLLPKADSVIAFNHPFELLIRKSGFNTTWYCNEPPDYILDGNPPHFSELLQIQNTIQKTCVATERDRQRFLSIYAKPDPVVIPYGIEYEYWSNGDPSNANKVYGFSEDDFVISHIGWYHPRKNPFLTLSIAAKNKNYFREKKVKFVFSGMPVQQYYENMIAFTSINSINDLVVFDAGMNRSKVKDLYARSDLAVFPYLDQGGFLSIFEAISSGCRVVVSDRTMCSDIVKKNKLGTVVDLYSFENEIKSAIEDGKKRIPKPVSEWVKNNLTWEQHCKKLEEVIVN